MRAVLDIYVTFLTVLPDIREGGPVIEDIEQMVLDFRSLPSSVGGDCHQGALTTMGGCLGVRRRGPEPTPSYDPHCFLSARGNHLPREAYEEN